MGQQIGILGAGLSGLSAAYHLGTGYDIFEQEAEVGGLCRTIEHDGFVFDYTGHLLHLRDDSVRQLITMFLPDCFQLHQRRANIYSQGRCIDYPFQANIHGLPVETIKECILGFVDSLIRHTSSNSSQKSLSFREWVLETFGAGVARYFMFPYNQKLWKTRLDEMAADWVAWSIPKPTFEEFLNGALGIKNSDFGYNPTFLYPESGGIFQLPLAFLSSLQADKLHLRKKVVAVDAQKRLVTFDDRSSYHYDRLISTLPLKTFVGLLQNIPESIRNAADHLRYISVYDINIGVNRPYISDQHWSYFPEPEFIFYRIGFPMNFSKNVVPEGCSSMYVEVSALPHEEYAEETLLEQVYDGLYRCGLLKKTDEILVADVLRLDCAYVIHDLYRSRALATILPCLEQYKISSIGRYGAWEYNSMEGAILAGKQIAKRLRL
ncbi:protoporphyrinogen oxidase [candidate division KSB3 bacterium]|uniref:Protoporphyrinogen oxidase n=1 Tax=candidate division KSB3 bacterium TaxID=2044937 RepID=A0A2G6KH31_9BACT|nr:MAG: protoporphyrinogen oxidase [candidate division KSB3 bacterium]